VIQVEYSGLLPRPPISV